MKLIFFFIVLFGSTSFNAQINSMSNERVFGGSYYDILNTFVQIPNSFESFLVATSNSNISFDKSQDSRGGEDIWLIKLDANNNIIWEKTIGGSGSDLVYSVILKDSLLYISVTSNSPISGEKTVPNTAYDSLQRSTWLLCLDLSGNIVWQKTGGYYTTNSSQLFALKNNNILIVSELTSAVRLYELNPINGDSITSKFYSFQGSQNSSILTNVSQSTNGEIFMSFQAGTGFNTTKTDYGYGSRDCWILKINENYEYLNDKCFGGSALDASGQILFKDNFLYIIATYSYSGISGNKTSDSIGEGDCWVIKVDLDMNIIWDKTFGGVDQETGSSAFFAESSSGDIIIRTSSKSGVSGNKTTANYGLYDAWIIRIDEDGNLKDQANIGGSLDDYGKVFSNENTLGQYIFAGTSSSPISGIKTLDNKGYEDIWLFNFNADELLSINETTVYGNINIFPNPFQDKVTFSFPEINETLNLKIFTLDGKMVYETSIEKNTLSKEVNLTDSKAIYFYEITGEKVSVSGKLVKVD